MYIEQVSGVPASKFSKSVASSQKGTAPRRDANLNRAHLIAALPTALDDDGRRAPWPHQVDAVRAIASHYAAGGVNAICVIPTAGGKTEIFQRLVSASHRSSAGLDLRTVVLVPTRQLIMQTVKRFKTEFPDLEVGYLGKDLGTVWSSTMVMTYARFSSMVRRGLIVPGDIDHLVLDEAHRGLSDLRQSYFRRFLGTTLVTAFSATPVFDVNKNVYRLLGSSNEVIHVTVAELMAARRIAPVVNVIVGVNLEGEMPDDPEVQARVLKAASVRAMLDIRASQRFPDMGFALSDRTFIAYAWDIEHGQGAAEAFSEANPREEFRPISYLTDQDAQGAAIQALADREISGIFNAMVLLEGTDISTLGAVYNLAPTSSLVRQMQRCGRALRLDPALEPDDPRQTGVVVDFFYRINGRMLGRPVFYCDAIGDRTIAIAIETAPIDFTPLLDGAVEVPNTTSADIETVRARALASIADAVEDDEDGDDPQDVEPSESAGAQDDDRSGEEESSIVDIGAHGVTSRIDIMERLGNVRVLSEVVDVVAITNERDKARFGLAEDGLTGRTDIAIRLRVAFDTPAVRGLFDGIEEEVLPLFKRDPMATLTVVREGVELDVCYRRVGFACYPQYRLDQIDRFRALCEATDVEKGDTWLRQTDIFGSRGSLGGWSEGFRSLIDEFTAKRRTMTLERHPIRRRLDAWSRTDENPSEADGALPIRMELCRNAFSRVVCFHRDDIGIVRQAVGLDRNNVEVRSEEWLGLGEIFDRLEFKSQPIREAMQYLAGRYDAVRDGSFDEAIIDCNETPIRVRRVRRHNARTFFCVHRDSVDDLIAATGVRVVPLMDEGWVMRNDVMAACDLTRKRFLEIWNALVESCEAGDPTVEGHAFRMEYRRSACSTLPCLAREDLERFVTTFSKR